jgi:hypothetical protein
MVQVEPWWIWTEDADNEHFHHTEYFLLQRKQKDEVHRLVFTIPVHEPLPVQYHIKYVRPPLRRVTPPSAELCARTGPCRTDGWAPKPPFRSLSGTCSCQRTSRRYVLLAAPGGGSKLAPSSSLAGRR